MADQIRYDLLTQQALRGVVRSVLTDAAKKKSLPGDHHFYIAFDTQADGVRMSDRLRGQYPEEMTIILQHQFWDLSVNEQGFEVGLSFGGIPEKLGIPFEAINGFFDPSVQFGLQFEDVVEGQETHSPAANAEDKSEDKSAGRPRPVPAPRTPTTVTTQPTPDRTQAKADASAPIKPAGGGGEVVRLDRFRKK